MSEGRSVKHAESLSGSESFYRTVVESFNDMLFVHGFSPEGKLTTFTQVNDFACRRLGYTREELLALSPLDVISQESLAEVPAEAETLLANQQLLFDKTLLTKSGDQIPVEISTRIVEVEGHSTAISIARDITQRKQADAQLKESEKKYRDLFTHMGQGFALHEMIFDEAGVPSDYVTLEVNQAYEDILGTTKEAVVGQKASQFVPEDELKEWVALFGKVVLDGTPTHYETYSPKNDRHFRGIAYSLENRRFAAIFEDITERKQAEESLRQSEAQYARIVETAQEGIWVIDADSKTQFVNKKMADMLGYTVKEMAGTPLTAFMDDEGKATAERNVKRRRQGIKEVHDFKFRRKDGSDLYALVSTNPLHDEHGEYAGALAMVADITERRRAEDALRRSEEKLRTIIDHSHEVYYIHDTAHQLTYASPRCVEVFGYTPEEMMVKWTTLVTDNPVNQEGFELTQRAIDTGERQPPYLLEIKRKNGQFRWVEVNESPVKNADGKVIGISGSIRDITEQRQAEEEARVHGETIRAIIETSQDWIWSIDADGVHTYSNPAIEAMLGYRPEELLGKPSFDLIHPEDLQKIEPVVAECVRTKQGWSDLLIRWRHRDGSWRHLESNAVPYFDAYGDLAGFRGVDCDVTERRQAEEQVQSLSELVRQSMDGMVQTDAEFRITYVNSAVEELYGWTLDELQGKTPGLFNAEPTADEIQRELYKIVSSGRIYSGEGLNRRKDGSTFVCQFRVGPLVDADGEIVGYFGSQRDVTESRRVQEILRQTYYLLESWMQNSPSVAFVKDLDGRITFVNRAFEKLFGLSAGEIIGKTDCDLYPTSEETAEQMRANDHQVIEADKPLTIDETVMVNGKPRDFVTIKFPLRDADGQITSIAGMATDVTELKHTAASLAESATRLQLATDATQIGYWDWDLTTSEVYLSPGWKKQLGYEDHEMPNRFEEWETRLHPDDRSPTLEAVEDYVAGRRDDYDIEFRLRHKDGSYRWIHTRADMRRDDNGEPCRLFGCHVNITATKEHEQELRRERDFADTLIETAQTIVLVLDKKGKIVRFNPYMEEICGYSLEEVEGKDWFETFLPERDRDRIRDVFRNAVADIPTRGDVNPIITKDGQERQIEWYDSAINDVDGKVVGLLSIGQDITERILTEQQLRQAQKMEAIGQLAGGVAHDFRNQLAVIMNWAEMLLAEGLADQAGKRHVEEILSAVRRSTGVIGQLLAFSRKETLQPAVVNVADVVVDLGKTLSHMIEEDVRLLIAPTDTDIYALLDPTLLEQAVMTLAINSRDAMPNGGELRIETVGMNVEDTTVQRYADVSPGRFAVVSVSDTGSGMDEETRLRVFDPFFTTKEVGKGTGLGLSMVYGFVRQSGGFVECESEPGKGTVIRMAFPAVAAPAEAVAPTPAGTAPPIAGGRETILVVEDHAPLRTVTVAMLRRAGYEVVHTSDAPAAMIAAEKHEGGIDLLLTDIVMPEISGLELAQRLRSVDPDMPVLFVSGYAQDELNRRGMDHVDGGALLIKPFKYDDLVSRVRELLDTAQDQPAGE